MAVTKIQIFSNWGARGWSDVWYTALDVSDGTLTAKILAVAETRAGLYTGANGPSTDGNPAPVYYRISDLNNPNKSQPFGFDAAKVWPRSGRVSGGDRRNWPYATILLASGGRHRILLKGAPSVWIEGNVNVRYAAFTGALKTAFLTYIATVQGAGFQGLTQVVSQETAITAVTVDANGRLNVTVGSGTWTPGQRVRVKGMRGPGTTKLNGATRIREVLTGNVLVLNKKKCSVCALDPDNKGKIGLITPALTAVEWPNVITGAPAPVTGFTSGKLGRAFSPELGKARPCCR
jgi:hypothetical protein